MILGSRFSEKILSTITEKCQNNDNIEEKYLEKYYILEKLPDDFDISKEIDRIDTFLNILKSQVQQSFMDSQKAVAAA